MLSARRAKETLTMLPPKSKASMINVGVYLSEDTLRRVDEIAQAEKVKSRNKLMGSFLTFAVDLFPLLKPLNRQIEEFAEREGKMSYAEAVAALVERSLKVSHGKGGSKGS